MDSRAELRALVWIFFFVAALSVGLRLREEYAKWACSSICEERGGSGHTVIEFAQSRCICTK